MSVQLIGVLNITPDSFSDGGDYVDSVTALARADELFEQGAAIVDVGAEATNPKASPLTVDAEWERLEAILQVLLHKYPGKISIDTRHAEIVERAAAIGKDFIVNDVTTFVDPAMIATTAKHGLRAIVSHMPLSAQGDFQQAHKGELIDDLDQVKDELLAQKAKMVAGGIVADKIIIDPGIGFGKTPELNRKLLEFARYVPDEVVLIGHSRKRFLGENRFEPEVNLEAAKVAIAAGSAYLRVHDPVNYTSLFSA